MKILWFDYETGGFAPSPSCEIVEAGWVVTEGDDLRVIERANHIVKVEHPIHPRAVEVHGITYDQCQREGIPWVEVAQKMLDSLEGCVAVAGHNSAFDVRFSKFWFGWVDLEWPDLHEICTQDLANRWVPKSEFKSRKLERLYEHFVGESTGEAHRALYDVEMTVDLARRLLEKGQSKISDVVSGGPLHVNGMVGQDEYSAMLGGYKRKG